MSEKEGVYIAGDSRKTELQFIAKRLTDFTKDFGDLDEKEKKYVIERANKTHSYGLVELYNALGKYME